MTDSKSHYEHSVYYIHSDRKLFSESRSKCYLTSL
jgi:hypothetical protein